MKSTTLSLLACPLCGGELELSATGARCAADDSAYPLRASGLLDLRPATIRAGADLFAADYRARRLAEGWRPPAPAAARALPDGHPPGFPPLYWPVRRESWAALRAVLPTLGADDLTIADAGAGFPWLSHRLAELGHQVVAFDLSDDADFGLGAVALYGAAFLAVLGSLEAPPLAAASYHAVICNASLHYVNNLADCLTRLARALRPEGALIVVDTPIAAGAGYPSRSQPESRVLGRAELDLAMRRAGLVVEWRRVRRGWAWRYHRIKNRLLRRPAFDFPLIVGRKETGVA